MSFISRQPNGLLCRFSTIVDTVTDYNMTDEEYIEMCAQKARVEAKDVLKSSLFPFNQIEAHFTTNAMTRKEFNKLLKIMKTKIEK